ncbi:hypothetical protein [Vibrio natriegens]|uniref:hypothetical protein n=1 Tax=Vibrio natriegens TaxID=691 RepID=UPI003B5A9540
MSSDPVSVEVKYYVQQELAKSRSKSEARTGYLFGLIALLVSLGVYKLITDHIDGLIRGGVNADLKAKAMQHVDSIKSLEVEASDRATRIETLEAKLVKIYEDYPQTIENIQAQLNDLEEKKVSYGEGLYLKASNNSEFLRHYHSNVRIGGERNKPYEKDRTWIPTKK